MQSQFSTGSSTKPDPLSSLVSSGTITQTQSDAVKSALQAAMQSHAGATTTNPMDSLVSNRAITQNQENTINSVFVAAMQAYGANQMT